METLTHDINIQTCSSRMLSDSSTSPLVRFSQLLQQCCQLSQQQQCCFGSTAIQAFWALHAPCHITRVCTSGSGNHDTNFQVIWALSFADYGGNKDTLQLFYKYRVHQNW